MSTGAAIPQNEAFNLEQDAEIILNELDYSRIAGDPGNLDYLFPFTDARAVGGTMLALNGRSYNPLPLIFKGVRLTTQGQQARPSLTVAEVVGGAFHSLIIPLRDLKGAVLTRKRIYRKHLDDGEQPDPSAVLWPPEQWVISRKLRATGALLEFELASKVDFDQIDLPTGRLEHGWCPAVYGPKRTAADSARCSWTRGPTAQVGGVQQWFGPDNAPVTVAEDDDCSLSYEGCRLRFMVGRQLPLDFGGFPAIRRLVQRGNIG